MNFAEKENFVTVVCESGCVRRILAALRVAAAAPVLVALVAVAPPANADPLAPRIADCNDAFCTPGIKPGIVLGSYCSDTQNYVFGTTSWGRLVFCGSPRRYAPRYFRSPSMWGVKNLNSDCQEYQNGVAQSPEGWFLNCTLVNGAATWQRGDIPPERDFTVS